MSRNVVWRQGIYISGASGSLAALAQGQVGTSSLDRLIHEMLLVCGSSWHQGLAESWPLLHLFHVFRLWL